MFDSISYFESKNIEYWTEGNNVTQGWVNIQCPFCHDSSNHFGVSPSDFFNCHICGETGHVTKLIREIDKCSWAMAERIKSLFQTDYEYSEKKFDPPSKIKLPGTVDIPKKARNYLKKRRFDPGHISNKYGLRYGGISGRWKFRLIIPFYLDRKLVTFSSRDVTGKQTPKYLHLSKKESIVDPANTLYNIDSVTDRMILVEGVTDVWRGGDGFVGINGKFLTDRQLNMVVRKGIRSAIVMTDSNAVAEGKKIATTLAGIIPVVEYIEYDAIEGDPDSIPYELIEKLRKEFF